MKTIRVKSYNKLIENIINEDSIKLDGNTNDYKGKLKKRITDAIRLAKECKIAAKKARDDGNDTDAEWLEKRAEDYENAAKTWNQDALDDEEDNSTDNKNKEPSQSEIAQNAANAAKRAARDAQDAANEAQNNAKKLADAGHDASAAQAAADKAQEKANEANKAAEEAQEHADKASKAEAAGDKDKAKAEAKAAEDAQNKAEQAANEAKETAKAASQKTASERAQDAAEAAEEAATNAQAKANNAQKKADDLKAKGKDASEAQAEADKAKEKADEAKKAAEEAKDHAEKAEKAEKSGDMTTANSEADKAEAAAENAKQAAGSFSDSADSNSDGGSGGGGGGGSGGGGSGGGSGDSVKNIFADDEDIPNMPSKRREGQEPRDPTIDDIIKQLSKLKGEAKRGAVDGLTDLVKKNKNESLAEAFSKGIREFSDKEWDDLNDETIDRINKIKQITTITDVEGKRAKVKSWSDNQVSRQELSDEESQNAQHDILQRRAREQELDKYNNLSGIKDFELDFEGCIRDQVEMVMQDYLTYDEINPEYELEDVIMKAEVQRMLPDEAIPTIAVFFDKSGSCVDAIPTLNNAIATVKKKYVDTGMCKLDLYYFGNWVAYNDAYAYVGGSTRAWPHIIDTIKQGDYNNVIVMSDKDIGLQNNNGESYTVTGCVWWLWVNGVRAPRCVKELRGMQHNFEGKIS